MIPKLLHQFWDTGIPPESVRSLLDTWQRLNHGWEYHLWDDSSVAKLIRDRFDARVERAYNACKLPAMRADVARYLLLWEMGGVYADADLTCLRPLETSINLSASLVVFRGWNGAWRNDFMAASLRCSVVGELLEQSVANIESRKAPNNLWLVTGPGMTTPIIEQALSGGYLNVQHFTFSEVKGNILNFNNDLDYRHGDRHWSLAQKNGVIYNE